uniref:Uncharacterized protein n=1 Tax=Arion vulgaris TaxID=1028688 RepID=A0A0B7A6K4_9EUPU
MVQQCRHYLSPVIDASWTHPFADGRSGNDISSSSGSVTSNLQDNCPTFSLHRCHKR